MVPSVGRNKTWETIKIIQISLKNPQLIQKIADNIFNTSFISEVS